MFELVFSASCTSASVPSVPSVYGRYDGRQKQWSVDKGCVARVTNKLIVLYTIYRRIEYAVCIRRTLVAKLLQLSLTQRKKKRHIRFCAID